MNIDLSFVKSAKTACDLAIFIVKKDAKYPEAIEMAGDDAMREKAEKIAKFSCEYGEICSYQADVQSPFGKVLLMGVDVKDASSETYQNLQQWMNLGGKLCGHLGKAEKINIFTDIETLDAQPDYVAMIGAGLLLKAYSFDQYKTVTKKQDADKLIKIKFVDTNSAAIKKQFSIQKSVVEGVILARNMVNEPANNLGPLEFAAQAKALEEIGIKTEILTEKQMAKLGMNALLGVAQGSVRPPRLAIMQWNGGKKSDKPIAFVGKGVVFDTGGISIKPSGGMEDMKGDMGGAAAVIGLMKTLALRKAKTNVVGILGLVENMPDGNAQRPGDIVTSMSGQTIEIINTDAEGRLVLCDALHYCKDRFKPQFMINLATLTGAIIVALGNQHAGIFSNDDALSARLTDAGLKVQERVWRMPIDKEYDKLIDSKFADMKNSAGRSAGSITAAQFLHRFVGDTPWVHIDVAGTAMSSPKTDINSSWGSGFGVRLLNQLVMDHYEA